MESGYIYKIIMYIQSALYNIYKKKLYLNTKTFITSPGASPDFGVTNDVFTHLKNCSRVTFRSPEFAVKVTEIFATFFHMFHAIIFLVWPCLAPFPVIVANQDLVRKPLVNM